MLVLLSVCSEVQMICIWFSWCHFHPVISCFIKIQKKFLSGAGLPRMSWKEAVKWVSVCQGRSKKFVLGWYKFLLHNTAVRYTSSLTSSAAISAQHNFQGLILGGYIYRYTPRRYAPAVCLSVCLSVCLLSIKSIIMFILTTWKRTKKEPYWWTLEYSPAWRKQPSWY